MRTHGLVRAHFSVCLTATPYSKATKVIAPVSLVEIPSQPITLLFALHHRTNSWSPSPDTPTTIVVCFLPSFLNLININSIFKSSAHNDRYTIYRGRHGTTHDDTILLWIFSPDSVQQTLERRWMRVLFRWCGVEELLLVSRPAGSVHVTAPCWSS